MWNLLRNPDLDIYRKHESVIDEMYLDDKD